METRDLVESIIVADENTNQKFLDLFAGKITNALEVRKVEIASGLMSEAMEGKKVSDYPHFHELAYGAMAQNAAGTKKQAGNVSIDPEHVLHVEKAEAELKAMKEKGADLVRMGGDLDDGAKPKGMKHAHKALGRVLYEQVEQVDEALESEFKNLGTRRNDTGRELEDADYQKHTYKVPRGLKPKFDTPVSRYKMLRKAAKMKEDVEQVDEASEPNLNMDDYPHFKQYAAGALKARGEGAPKSGTQIHSRVKGHLDRAENELKAAKQKGHNLSQLGADADEGKHNGFKDAYKMLGKAYYNFEEVEQIDEISRSTAISAHNQLLTRANRAGSHMTGATGAGGPMADAVYKHLSNRASKMGHRIYKRDQVTNARKAQADASKAQERDYETTNDTIQGAGHQGKDLPLLSRANKNKLGIKPPANTPVKRSGVGYTGA